MASNAPGIVKRPNAYFIDPKVVKRREGWNVRFDFGDIERLADSIKAELDKDPASGGLINDIRVKRLAQPVDGFIFELVDGDRRLTAIELLMSKGVVFPDGVPAKIENKAADDLDLLVRMFTANQGKPLLPLEEADAFKRMQDAGMTLAQIEKAVGKSDNYIVGTLALLTADQSLQDAVKDGAVSGGVAKAIAVSARGDKAKQAEIVADVKAAGTDKVKRRAVLKKIEAARVAKAAKVGKVLKMKSLSDADLSEIGAKVAKNLAAKALEAGWADMTGQDAEVAIAAMVELVQKDEALVAAFTLGALQALKAAAGLKVNLDL